MPGSSPSPPLVQEPSATNSFRRLEWIVWGALIATVVGIAAAFVVSRVQQETIPPLPIIGPVGDFVLTNQHGQVVSAADLRGNVWVGNIIFTRCAGPCPLMTQAMADFQNSLPSSVRLVTLTTDPDYDTPEVLKRFGEKYNADFRRWTFLTGSKEQIARLAVNGLKLTALEKPEPERAAPADLFIHSTLFVIIDPQGNLRAAYELEDPELRSKVPQQVRALLER